MAHSEGAQALLPMLHVRLALLSSETFKTAASSMKAPRQSDSYDYCGLSNLIEKRTQQAKRQRPQFHYGFGYAPGLGIWV